MVILVYMYREFHTLQLFIKPGKCPPKNHPMHIDWKVKLYRVHQPVIIIGPVFQLVASCEARSTVSAVQCPG